MGKDKSIIEKFADTVREVAKTATEAASEALKPGPPSTVEGRTATYVPLAADGLVANPLMMAPMPESRERRKRRAKRATRKPARKAARKPTKKSARTSPARAAKKVAKKSSARKTKKAAKTARKTTRKTPRKAKASVKRRAATSRRR